MAVKACLFDAYGTLLDVGSATARLVASNQFPALADKGAELSTIWREKQLSYSWLRGLMGTYVPFWQCTCDGLDYALEATNLGGDAALRDALLLLYRQLSAYDDAASILAAAGDAGLSRAILSNGNHEMLAEAVTAACLDDKLEAILSVEDVQTFKPAPAVYQMGCAHFGISPEEVLFFSSNGWDIAGARQFGYQTIWVNRTAQIGEKLGDGPHYEVQNLNQAGDVMQKLL